MAGRHQHHYVNGRLNLRVPPRTGLTVQALRALGTDVVLLREVTSIRVSVLDPSAGDTLMLGTPRGELRIQSGSEALVVPGNQPVAVLHSQVQIDAPTPTNVVVAAVSKPEMQQIGVTFTGDLQTIKFFDVDSLLFLPFVDTVLGIFARNHQRSIALAPHHATLLHLMGAGVLRRRTEHSGETLVARARTLIMQTHRDPQTTPRSLALKLGVSLRTLQRAYSAEGAIVGDEIRHARAKTARHFLQHDDRTRGRVSRAAKNAGFKSVASMHRALDALTEQALESSAGSVPPPETETARSA